MQQYQGGPPKGPFPMAGPPKLPMGVAMPPKFPMGGQPQGMPGPNPGFAPQQYGQPQQPPMMGQPNPVYPQQNFGAPPQQPQMPVMPGMPPKIPMMGGPPKTPPPVALSTPPQMPYNAGAPKQPMLPPGTMSLPPQQQYSPAGQPQANQAGGFVPSPVNPGVPPARPSMPPPVNQFNPNGAPPQQPPFNPTGAPPQQPQFNPAGGPNSPIASGPPRMPSGIKLPMMPPKMPSLPAGARPSNPPLPNMMMQPQPAQPQPQAPEQPPQQHQSQQQYNENPNASWQQKQQQNPQHYDGNRPADPSVLPGNVARPVSGQLPGMVRSPSGGLGPQPPQPPQMPTPPSVARLSMNMGSLPMGQYPPSGPVVPKMPSGIPIVAPQPTMPGGAPKLPIGTVPTQPGMTPPPMQPPSPVPQQQSPPQMPHHPQPSFQNQPGSPPMPHPMVRSGSNNALPGGAGLTQSGSNPMLAAPSSPTLSRGGSNPTLAAPNASPLPNNIPIRMPSLPPGALPKMVPSGSAPQIPKIPGPIPAGGPAGFPPGNAPKLPVMGMPPVGLPPGANPPKLPFGVGGPPKVPGMVPMPGMGLPVGMPHQHSNPQLNGGGYSQPPQQQPFQPQQQNNQDFDDAPPAAAVPEPAPPVVIPTIEIDADAPPVMQPFEVHFKTDKGVLLPLNCNPDASVLEFLSDAMLDLLEHVEQDDFMTCDLSCGNDQESIDNSTRVSLSSYIRTCVAKGITPVVSLKGSATFGLGFDMDESTATPANTAFAAPVSAAPTPTSTSPVPAGGASAPLSSSGPSRLPPSRPSMGAPGGRVFGQRASRTPELDSADKRRSVFLAQNVVTSMTADNFSVHFVLMDQQPLDVPVHGSDLITTVKDLLGTKAREFLGMDLGSMDKYLLKVPGASVLNNENETIKSLPYVHNCLMKNVSPVFVVLEKSSQQTKLIKKNNLEIGSLIGRPLTWVQMDDEITSFRQSMTRERYFIRQKAKEANVGHSSGDIPVHLSDAICKPNGGKTMVQLRLELLSVKKTVLAFETDSAAQFIERYFQKHYANQPQAYGKSPADFVLKATGLAEYIYGSYPFHQFEFIRECIVKNKPIDLSLIALDQVQTVGQSGQQAADDGSLEDESFLIDDPHLKYDHAEISVSNENRGWDQMACISVFDLESRPFRFKLIGVDNVSPGLASWQTATGKASSCDDVPFYMYTTVALCCGDELIEGYTSELVPSSSHPRFAEWCNFAIRMANLPRDVRMCFTLWLAKKREINKELDTPLGWVNFQVFDYKHELHTGVQSLNMWPDDKANPIGTTVQNADGQNPSTLYIDFEQFTLPVVFPTEPMQFSPFPVPSTMESHDANALQRIWNTDPLYRLTQRDKHLLWKYREFCKTQPKALPKFLQAVPKANRFAVQEMYRLMAIWAPMSPLDALELLDAKYADAKIREYAVNRIDDLPNDDVVDYLLQLVQVLKYEPYHDTALARFLLRRALNSKIIGHHFFWFLKSEIHVQEISERFGLLLEAYLRGCGSHRQQLATQDAFQQKFVHTANHIKGFGTSDRLNVLRDELGKLQFPSTGISLPLNPRIEVTGLKVDKCKYMDSKKLPLWLVFKNADPKGSDPYVIFKSGDDLRQDMLTLQLIRIMDKLWKQNGMDLKLNPYGCISTGNEVGMIEVVLNSMTTASITRTAGGATAAFREDPIANWLRENNQTDSEYRLAVENFILSCAGYCVATYVLGIGDRHNDNIMCTRDGRLFHIDFGHFLGNFKKKFGVKRERAPFVFTPDFAYVMGGKDHADYAKFVETACRAFNLLRRNANIFINLFAMMLSTGIPELQTANDIEYLRDAFSLEMNESQAADKFKQLIQECLYTRATQINNYIHIIAH